MKNLIITAAVLMLGACSEPADSAEAVSHVEASSSAVEAAAPGSTFTVESVPLSQVELAPFPYLAIPEGFRLTQAKDLELERKYVFPHGATQTVEGRYRHGRVMVADTNAEWNETLLLSRLDSQIRTMGGVRLFDGSMPDDARALLASESPRFVQDLYDPAPYRFRQYAIRTDKALIWIEAGYGYNSPMIDLTVLEQPLPAANEQ